MASKDRRNEDTDQWLFQRTYGHVAAVVLRWPSKKKPEPILKLQCCFTASMVMNEMKQKRKSNFLLTDSLGAVWSGPGSPKQSCMPGTIAECTACVWRSSLFWHFQTSWCKNCVSSVNTETNIQSDRLTCWSLFLGLCLSEAHVHLCTSGRKGWDSPTPRTSSTACLLPPETGLASDEA